MFSRKTRILFVLRTSCNAYIFTEHRLFKGPDININLHVFTVGSKEIDRHLTLRYWLRKNPSDRELYAEAKRELARQNWRYVQNYADAKSSVIEGIISRAGTSTGKSQRATVSRP